MFNLEDHRIADVPDSAYFIKNFITEAEETLLIGNIKNTPKPRWTQLSNRRLINIGGCPHIKGMIAESIPKYLQVYIDRVNNLNIFNDKLANHILLNEYEKGQGIMPHLDGPLFYPTISTLSLGSHCVINFFKPNVDNADELTALPTQPEFKIFVEPRSLFILKNDMYHKYYHSIAEINEDDLTDPLLKNIDRRDNLTKSDKLERTTRYSLTIRHVPKTTKTSIVRLGFRK